MKKAFFDISDNERKWDTIGHDTGWSSSRYSWRISTVGYKIYNIIILVHGFVPHLLFQDWVVDVFICK